MTLPVHLYKTSSWRWEASPKGLLGFSLVHLYWEHRKCKNKCSVFLIFFFFFWLFVIHQSPDRRLDIIRISKTDWDTYPLQRETVKVYCFSCSTVLLRVTLISDLGRGRACDPHGDWFSLTGVTLVLWLTVKEVIAAVRRGFSVAAQRLTALQKPRSFPACLAATCKG